MAVVWSPVWATLVYYTSLIVVLSFMPNGLFGRAAVRRNRRRGSGRVTARLTARGLKVAIAIAVLGLFPIVFSNPTTTSIAVFTLIFMVAASAWNIFRLLG